MKTEINLTKIGLILGMLVPVLATLADFYFRDVALSFANLCELYTQDKLLWIILTTPFAVGIIFYYFSRKVAHYESGIIADRNANHDELTKLEDIIVAIEKGDYSEKPLNFSDPKIAQLLTSLKDRLLQQKQEDEKTRWMSEGHAHFAKIFREASDTASLCDLTIKDLVKYTGMNQGSIFLATRGTEPVRLELKACYAYHRKKFLTKEIDVGDGLVGQCFLERDTIVLTDIPADYVSISSGLGEARPRFIIITPIKYNDVIAGVIEMASFTILPDHYIRFIEKTCENMTTVLQSFHQSEETRQLLEATRLQAEQLRSQEEEMRQNMEELSATQEAMERKAKESAENSSTLDAIFDSAVDAIITISQQGIIERVNKACLHLFDYSAEELIGSNVKIIMPEPHHSKHDQYLSAYQRTGTRKIIGKARVAEGRRKDGTLFPVELAVNEANIGERVIYTGIVRDISERVKAEAEKQEQMEELRAQEEELRQNMEELHAIQERLEEQLRETQKHQVASEIRETVLGITTILSESNLHGGILYVNAKFCEVSQYSFAELIGKPHSIVRHPDMPKDLFRLLWSTIKEGNVFKGIIKNRCKDGTPYWVDATIVPIRDEKGNVVKYIGARYHIKNEQMALELYNEQAQRYGWPVLKSTSLEHPLFQ
jgi:methyl-accepting chemotaxis protein